jgi:hypothetical protein
MAYDKEGLGIILVILQEKSEILRDGSGRKNVCVCVNKDEGESVFLSIKSQIITREVKNILTISTLNFLQNVFPSIQSIKITLFFLFYTYQPSV